MLRSAYYRIYCIYFDQILYSDKDHQNSSLNGPNTRTTNPKRRTDGCHFETNVQNNLTESRIAVSYHPCRRPLSAGDLNPHLIRGSLDSYKPLPNGPTIGSAVFTQLTYVPITQTRRPRHVRHLYSKRPHLCTVCIRYGLKWIISPHLSNGSTGCHEV